MKSVKLWVLSAMILAGHLVTHGQVSPDLENGIKHWGSYDESGVDTVNNLNGNVMVHASVTPGSPQRGALTLENFLYQTSKTWQAQCKNSNPANIVCWWAAAWNGVTLQESTGLVVQRTTQITGSGTGTPTYSAFGYSLTTADGAQHQVVGVPGTQDSTGEATQFDTIDTSGYHLSMSNFDPGSGAPLTATVTDRHGNRYVAQLLPPGTCGAMGANHIVSGSPYLPIVDDAPLGNDNCPQIAYAQQVIDSNGNQITFAPSSTQPGVDTLGRNDPFSIGNPNTAFGQVRSPFTPGAQTNDYSGCVTSHSMAAAFLISYNAPDGSTRQTKWCFANVPIQTAFNLSGYVDSVGAWPQLVTLVLADSTRWTFDYDAYGNIAFVGLPGGGTINYTWTTIGFPSCGMFGGNLSRAVATRTLNDNSGHSYQWRYNWGAPGTTMTNTVTDPLNNDTVHVFTALDGTGIGGCTFYETTTQHYQGTGGARQLLKQVDKTYSSAGFAIENGMGMGTGNVVPTDIKTTAYPSGKVNLVTRQYDPGPGNGAPIFGNVTVEKEYDWGQGSPGALLRETDTSYQWQVNSAYLTAHLLDLPATVIVKDGSGCTLAETDYTYDEASYLTPANISTQHVAPPNGVRGNLTTVTKWLAPASSCNPRGGSAVVSHTNWYDTGEVFQQIDPLGHTTTHSYDPAYVGAYSTQTCNALNHCVSGTYDFNTGVLTSFTNENATQQASANTPGDAGHTSNYTYDFMWRLTQAQAPPDPSNGNARATTTFTYSQPNVFPLSVQRTKSITNGMNDSATAVFDGFGRPIQTQHAVPGNTVLVDTVYDGVGQVVSVSNPYFSTSDSTYGLTQTFYDALGRPTRVAKQDGSVSSVAYDLAQSAPGDCTQTTDEANKQRITCSDGLGRLIGVLEPGVVPTQNDYTVMQNDGNFVVYSSSSAALWSTSTSSSGPTTLVLQNDGNLVLYAGKWQVGVQANPAGSFTRQSCSVGNTLNPGQGLSAGSCLTSAQGQYDLLMQSDGNLVLYNFAGGSAAATWSSGTFGNAGAYAIMQGDGNFVVYSSAGAALWSSGTSGSSAQWLALEDSGLAILFGPAWTSGTSQGAWTGSLSHPGCDQGTSLSGNAMLHTGSCLVSANGRFELLMQGDGNLVLYDENATPATTMWSSGTEVSPLAPGIAWTTVYAYDGLSNLTRVDQKGSAPNDSTQWRTRLFTHDTLGRLLTAQNPESGTTSYSYDPVGNLLQKTSPAPNAAQGSTATQIISYCYDALNRVTGKAYSAQSCQGAQLPSGIAVVSYNYDQGANAIGKLTSLTDQAGAGSYNYDILARMTGEQRTIAGVTKSMGYGYNLDGSLASLTYPSGATITYTPDSAGRMLSAVDNANSISYASQASYGADGSLSGFVSGASGGFAGISNSFSFNKRLQPVNMSATTPSATIFSLAYDFHDGAGDNGNVWGITNNKDTSRNQAFTYDPLNRLASAQNAGTDCTKALANGKTEYWGNSYGYDAWGNLLSKSVTKCSAESLSVTAAVNNQLQGGYLYDAAGNITHDATSGWNYAYDQENRITGANGFTYTYDGDGNRVGKANGSTGTLYWYMSPGIVAESDLSGNLQSEYVFFDGERVARKDFPGGAVSYYFSDHLKTTDIVTDARGNIKNESDFYPWGGELQFTANDSNHYKFTGKERDIETGLDYFGARYYSNGLGRFITPDWAVTPEPVPYGHLDDPQTLNLYRYPSNPETYADPDGHCDWCRDAWDYGTGIVRGIVSSATWGYVGAPTSNDSTMSLGGQLLGTGIEGGVSTDLAVQGVGTAGAGLLAAPETGGVSLGLTVVGGVEVGVGVAGTIGAVKNNSAILNAMAKKGTESGSRPGQDFTPAGKREIDARDGNACQGHGCSRTVRSVRNTRGKPTPPDQRQRHHIVPKNEGGSGTPENGKTLCPACHKEEHRKMREAKKNQSGS